MIYKVTVYYTEWRGGEYNGTWSGANTVRIFGIKENAEQFCVDVNSQKELRWLKDAKAVVVEVKLEDDVDHPSLSLPDPKTYADKLKNLICNVITRVPASNLDRTSKLAVLDIIEDETNKLYKPFLDANG